MSVFYVLYTQKAFIPVIIWELNKKEDFHIS